MSRLPSHSQFAGQRVTVMGLGRFGGGVGAVRFLASRGARLTVTDTASEADLRESLARLEGLTIDRWRLGGHDENDFRQADLIVVNPAVPRDNRFLNAARSVGVPLSSEMNLFWQLQRGRTIAVTGSNGKSTTTAMIHAMLEAAGHRAWLGGNIGQSLLPHVDEIAPTDWCVLELSSFQLEDLDRLRPAPDAAVVTGFSPNHLDRHRTLAAYRRAKQTIFRWQTPEQAAVLNADDAEVRRWPTRGRRWSFGDCGGRDCDNREPGVFRTPGGIIGRLGAEVIPLPLDDWLTLPGEHNRRNAMAAAAAALSIGLSADDVRRGLESYQPLPHRLQFVAEVAGRRFYNDSLATTCESVAAALDAFSAPVVLLAGGYDKRVDLRPLANVITRGAKAAALMGQTAEPLQRLIGEQAGHLPLCCCRSFDEAFRWAAAQSAAGDVVLLSPGCASYDWFRNFAERGERFVKLVHDWKL